MLVKVEKGEVECRKRDHTQTVFQDMGGNVDAFPAAGVYDGNCQSMLSKKQQQNAQSLDPDSAKQHCAQVESFIGTLFEIVVTEQ